MSIIEKMTEPHERLFLCILESEAFLRKLAIQLLEPIDMTPMEYQLLRVIQNTPGVTAKDIRKRLRSTAASVSQNLDKLKEKCMIALKKDANDARVYHIHLNEKGNRTTIAAKNILLKHAKYLGISKSAVESVTKELSTMNSSISSFLST